MFLGIDGGQTKTAGIIINDRGESLGHCVLTGMPHQGELNSDSQEIFRQLIQKLCCSASIKITDIKWCCAGLCGIDFAEDLPRQMEMISHFLSIPEEKLLLVNDAVIALWGGTVYPAALLLQHGTAFTSAIRNDWEHSFLFDCYDIGKIYDIRHELLARTARMIDGRLPETGLKNAVLDFFQIKEEALFNHYIDYQIIPLQKQLETAPLIFNAWANGDEAAEEMVLSAIDDYMLMIKIMIKKMPAATIEAVLGGGLLNRAPDSFYSLFSKKLKSLDRNIILKRPEMPPVLGAAVLAGMKAGHDPARFYELVKQKNKSQVNMGEVL